MESDKASGMTGTTGATPVRDMVPTGFQPARWSIEPAGAGTMEHRAGQSRTGLVTE